MRARSLPASAFTLLGAALVALPAGCGSPDKPKATSADKRPQEDPWLKLVTALRQESDAATCRRVLSDLNQALASAPADSQRKLGDAEAALAQSALNLSEAEMKEIRASGYTSLDPNHLAEGLYLRDVARTLDIAQRPVAERARIAFEWVCRQVVLHPWATPVGANGFQPNPPLPPTYVLRRGWGSGLERMFVFAALARQLEIEACLIGPAEAVNRPVLFQPPGQTAGFPRGPFWAMGVRDGADILLFDPWKAQALPGKNGRPATLADVRADPRGLAVWLDNKEFAWATTADDLKAGEVFLVASLSSVAPRNKTLEEKLAADLGAKLFVNLAEAKKSMEAAAKGVPVRYYSPAQEAFAPTRALNTFLPTGEGGAAAEIPNAPGWHEKYLLDQLPKGQLFKLPPGLEYAEPKERLLRSAVVAFAGAFLSPPTPREKLQRGQFVEVTRTLVRIRDQFGNVDARLWPTDVSAASTKEWVEQANALYERFNLAGPRDAPAIRAKIEELWKENSPTLMGIVGSAISQSGVAEATFLLALAKHEQAERAGARAAAAKAPPATRGAAADAWAEAREWWTRYEPFAALQSQNYPGRADLAKRLSERANAMGGGK